MASSSKDGSDTILNDILATLKQIQGGHTQLSASVDSIRERIDVLDFHNDVRQIAHPGSNLESPPSKDGTHVSPIMSTPLHTTEEELKNDDTISSTAKRPYDSPQVDRKAPTTSRIILTTYPGQSGIDPIPLDWGNSEPMKRGPVVVSRHQNTVRRRNGK